MIITTNIRPAAMQPATVAPEGARRPYPGGTPPVAASAGNLFGHGIAPAPPYRPMPTSASFVIQPQYILVPERGYATPAPAPAASLLADSTPTAVATAAAKTATSTKTTYTAKELSFLDDKKLSIEEKLFRFMALMLQKSDQEMINEMKSYAAKKNAASGSGSSAKSLTGTTPSTGSTSPTLIADAAAQPAAPAKKDDGGGGFFGFIDDAIGAVGDALGGTGKMMLSGAESIMKEVGGPMLAAAATAFGFPELAPIAMQYGGDLSAGLLEGIGSLVDGEDDSEDGVTSGGASSGSGTANGGVVPASMSQNGTVASATSTPQTATTSTSTSSTANSSDMDEKMETFNLQRMAEKQSMMFSALSNILKSMHDAQMTSVQNIR